MKKKIIIGSVILIIMIVICLIIYFVPLGNRIYKINSKYDFKLPKLTTTNDKKENELVVTSFRSSSSITKDFNKFLSSLDKQNCYDSTIYYDKNQDVSISDYTISKSGFGTKLIIKYVSRNWCTIISEKEDDEKHKFDFNYQVINPNNNKGLKEIYSNTDINISVYDIDDIQVVDGGFMYTLIDTFNYKHRSINDILEYMEYEISRDRGTKEMFDENRTLYKDNRIALLVCSTNKYIFGTKSLEYNRELCE